MSKYEQSKKLADLAAEVIENTPELQAIADVPIAYMWCDSDKHTNGKTVYADTEKISDKHMELSGYAFCITFYKPNCQYLDAERMAILMEHELLHVGVNFKDDGSIRQRFIRPHDIEDFEQILRKYGMHWVQGDDQAE